jgi:thiol:disulfide interchange protein
MATPIHRLLARAGAMAACLFALVGCDIRDEAVLPVMPDLLVGGAEMAAGSGAGHGIEYVSGYEAGLKRAAAERKPLLLIFKANWCRFSAELTQRTLANERVIGLSRRSVCVMVDADRDADICRQFGVKAFPTLVILPVDGGEPIRKTGRPTAAAVAADLEKALDPPHIAGAAPAGSILE